MDELAACSVIWVVFSRKRSARMLGRAARAVVIEDVLVGAVTSYGSRQGQKKKKTKASITGFCYKNGQRCTGERGPPREPAWRDGGWVGLGAFDLSSIS